MKRIYLCIGVLILAVTSAQSQTQPKKARSKSSSVSKVVQSGKTQKAKANSPNAITMNSTGNYAAKATLNSSSVSRNYVVSDPILRTLDARANGADIKINKSGIVGMPKRAYGFANGHILLSTTGATTSGTQTGSGSVGTGTSLGTFGSSGPAMNVNGKSPYAGINMWGNAMNMNIIRIDSSVRLTPAKKQ